VADTNCLLGWQLKCGRYKLFIGLATKMWQIQTLTFVQELLTCPQGIGQLLTNFFFGFLWIGHLSYDYLHTVGLII
jgi:hypothetical protein